MSKAFGVSVARLDSFALVVALTAHKYHKNDYILQSALSCTPGHFLQHAPSADVKNVRFVLFVFERLLFSIASYNQIKKQFLATRMVYWHERHQPLTVSLTIFTFLCCIKAHATAIGNL
jgi:hypothetical protein